MNGDFSHFIFPAIILIIAIARMMGRARQASSGRPPVSRPASRPPAESEAERQRRFLEAVGLPPGSQIPPQVSPRTGANPAPLQPINPHWLAASGGCAGLRRELRRHQEARHLKHRAGVS